MSHEELVELLGTDAIPLSEGDLVVLEDRSFDNSGDVLWKPRAYGMVFRIRAPYFWAFWSDEGKDLQGEPCGLTAIQDPPIKEDLNVPFRYRKFA